MEWDVLIIRYSEIAVKGRHARSTMTWNLKNNIRIALEREGIEHVIEAAPGRIYVKTVKKEEMMNATTILKRVFGLKSISPSRVYLLEPNLEATLETIIDEFIHRIKGASFRIRARRIGKHDFTSKDVERIAGAKVLERRPDLNVNLEDPDYTLWVEVRGEELYVYDMIIHGPGGLPIGSSGKSLVLFSGGFDSTVASWYILHRGAKVDLIYYDIGDEENFEIAKQAAENLYNHYVMGAYSLSLIRVWFHAVSEKLASQLNPSYATLILRRFMLEHAARYALSNGYHNIGTGESLAQVSSQTAQSLLMIGANLPLPVLRPLIGFDKDDIVRKAAEIGVYDIVSHQREFCAQRRRRPTPKPNPRTYEKELLKARQLAEILVKKAPIKRYVIS